jgi:hypothetical protein
MPETIDMNEIYKKKYGASPVAAPSSFQDIASNLSSPSGKFDDVYKFMGAMTDKFAALGEKRRAEKKQFELEKIKLHNEPNLAHTAEQKRQFNVANPDSLIASQLDPVKQKLAASMFEREDAPRKETEALKNVGDVFRKSAKAGSVSSQFNQPKSFYDWATGWIPGVYNKVREVGEAKLKSEMLGKLGVSADQELPIEGAVAGGKQLKELTEGMRKRKRIDELAGGMK